MYLALLLLFVSTLLDLVVLFFSSGSSVIMSMSSLAYLVEVVNSKLLYSNLD